MERLCLLLVGQQCLATMVSLRDCAGPLRAPNNCRGTLDCARKLMAASGWRGLWVGFGPCFARSIPANSAAFLTFEVVRKALT